MRIAISESTRNYSTTGPKKRARCGAHCSETPRDTLLLRVPRRLGTIIAKKALFQQFSIFFNTFQHVFNIVSTCFQHCFQRVGNTFQRVFNMRTWSGIRSISRIFPEICRWGAFENPQKSVNRPDPTFTHRFHGYSPKMRSGVWIRPISRFFRKFADGEPENLEKWEKWINNDSKII